VTSSNPSSVLETFNKVRYQLGIPSVVIYNAYGHHNVAQNDPLDLHLETFQQSLNANTTSTFLAAQQAVEGFRELPASMNKTFIYTGNMLNTTTMPSLLTLGLGKKATSYLIEASAIAYESDAFR
jgi:NAD(P)-dependent dehydrogenase (short-subunit alcohol dehydrogenase family)